MSYLTPAAWYEARQSLEHMAKWAREVGMISTYGGPADATPPASGIDFLAARILAAIQVHQPAGDGAA